MEYVHIYFNIIKEQQWSLSSSTSESESVFFLYRVLQRTKEIVLNLSKYLSVKKEAFFVRKKRPWSHVEKKT